MQPDALAPAGRLPGTSHPDQYVVCVDDDAEFVKSLELFLPERIDALTPDGARYQFLFFTDPAEALEAVSELLESHALLAMVITDQQMPQMKGTTFLARIKERCPDCARVLLTGHAGLDSAIAAINERLLDKYLTKPIDDEDDFTVTVRLLLNGYQMQRTIGSQQRTIGDLYRFSNALSECEDLEGTLDRIGFFMKEALECRHAAILLDGPGSSGGAPADRDRRDRGAIEVFFGADTLARLASCRQVGTAETLADVPGLDAGAAALGGMLPAGPYLYAVLRNADRVLGLLIDGGSTGVAGFHANTASILTHVADTAGIAIQNQRQRAALALAFTETKSQAEALAAANRRLEMLDRLKSDFLDFVSHELRTSLTSLSALDLLQPGSGHKDQAVLLEAVQSGYHRLRSLVERGLDYIDRVSERGRDEFEVIELANVVREAAASMPELDPVRVAGASYPDAPCPVLGSRADLRSVIRTMLDNAVKFSPAGSPVGIRLVVEGESAVLAVTDRGVGIDPAILPELFHPFTIGDSLHHAKGSALSLAVASTIANAHGGDIRAMSAGAKQGATFFLRVPLHGAGAAKKSTARSPSECSTGTSPGRRRSRPSR